MFFHIPCSVKLVSRIQEFFVIAVANQFFEFGLRQSLFTQVA